MSKDNEKIINSFWSQRLNNAIKKYGAKTINKEQYLTELSDGISREEYAKFVIGEVLKGIGDTIPKERFSVNLGKPSNGSICSYLTACIDIDNEPKPQHSFWYSSFYIEFYDNTIRSCHISLGGIDGHVGKNFKCINHQAFGKILADIYETHERDFEECKRLVAKSEKVQKIVGLGFQTIIENLLKGTKLDWAVTERENGKLQINVRLTPRKILTMIVKTNTFDNDYKQITDLLNILNTLMNEKKIDIKIRGESYHDNIQWHGN